MELTVKLVSGESRSVRVSGNATVGELKRAAAQTFDVPASCVRLSTGNGGNTFIITLDIISTSKQHPTNQLVCYSNHLARP